MPWDKKKRSTHYTGPIIQGQNKNEIFEIFFVLERVREVSKITDMTIMEATLSIDSYHISAFGIFVSSKLANFMTKWKKARKRV